MKGIVFCVALLGISSVFASPLKRSCSCNGGVGSGSLPQNPGRYAPECSASQLNTLFPDCENNYIFYRCTGLQRHHTFNCAPGTMFSFERQTCVHPVNFRVSEYCQRMVLESSDASQGSLIGNPALYGPACSAGQLNTLWPDCSANSVFYQCTSLGNFLQMPCGPGTAFDYNRQVCVHTRDFVVSSYCLNFHQAHDPVPEHPILDEVVCACPANDKVFDEVEKEHHNCEEVVHEEKKVVEEEEEEEKVKEEHHHEEEEEHHEHEDVEHEEVEHEEVEHEEVEHEKEEEHLEDDFSSFDHEEVEHEEEHFEDKFDDWMHIPQVEALPEWKLN